MTPMKHNIQVKATRPYETVLQGKRNKAHEKLMLTRYFMDEVPCQMCYVNTSAWLDIKGEFDIWAN